MIQIWQISCRASPGHRDHEHAGRLLFAGMSARSPATNPSGRSESWQAPRFHIGPADQGRKMTLEEFREAEEAPGYRYELARGVLEVTEVPNDPHGQIVDNLHGGHSIVYHRERPGRILRIGGASEFRLWIPEMISGRNPDLADRLPGHAQGHARTTSAEPRRRGRLARAKARRTRLPGQTPGIPRLRQPRILDRRPPAPASHGPDPSRRAEGAAWSERVFRGDDVDRGRDAAGFRWYRGRALGGR